MSWPGVRQRRVATNGIALNIAEAGEGLLVLLLHGFPESWYSWRHQFAPLASAGSHVVAPRHARLWEERPAAGDRVILEFLEEIDG
ncbi:alpha/beta fold hydrolase [Thermaurantiacus sp.]